MSPTPIDSHARDDGSGLRAAWRDRLNEALFDLHSPLGRRVNLIIMAIIVAGVLMSMVGTVETVPPAVRETIRWAEFAITGLFAGEYLLRLCAARRPLAYAFGFYGLVDLLTWLPLLLVGDAHLGIRLLRVMRLLKFLRYMSALRLFLASMRDTADIVMVVVASTAMIATLAGNLIHFLEPETFPNAFVGVWWSLVTMTTVGYGDLVPRTVPGMIEAALLMLAGITIFAMLTGTIAVKVAEVLRDDTPCDRCSRHVSRSYAFCPHCGAPQPEDS